ncbi:MAG: ribosome biogenesis GTP-binding protein YihA/YsxC [Candidatus Melainabacteria bacterium]|nr:ribosome biogenesis GTP-binding protein YihA/YsxC [Candidatus Melainabacteria bacterium]
MTNFTSATDPQPEDIPLASTAPMPGEPSGLPITFRALNARFLLSAPSIQFSPPASASRPEIAMIGRSNVGKSSFINALCQRRQLAKTSNTPGKTRLMNFYEVTLAKETATLQERRDLWLVDLPGYGYAKVSKTEQQQWQKKLEQFLTQRSALAYVLHLIDARHGATPLDEQMNAWLVSQGMNRLIVLTKTDLTDQKTLRKHLAQTSEAFSVDASMLLTFSSKKPAHVSLAWQQMVAMLPEASTLA